MSIPIQAKVLDVKEFVYFDQVWVDTHYDKCKRTPDEIHLPPDIFAGFIDDLRTKCDTER